MPASRLLFNLQLIFQCVILKDLQGAGGGWLASLVYVPEAAPVAEVCLHVVIWLISLGEEFGHNSENMNSLSRVHMYILNCMVKLTLHSLYNTKGVKSNVSSCTTLTFEIEETLINEGFQSH